MLKGPFESIELALRLMDVKVKREPYNPLYLRILTALKYEKEGKKEKALNLYLTCKEDEFAQSRIQALSPLEMIIPSDLPPTDVSKKIKLINHLTKDEHTIFSTIVALQGEKKLLTRDALAKKTKFPNQKILALIEKLQSKGYLVKPERNYRHIKILHTPVEQDNVIGLPHDALSKDATDTTCRQLIFSPLEKRLYVVNNSAKVKEKENFKVQTTTANQRIQCKS